MNSSTDRRKWISGSFNVNLGGFLSGSQVSIAPSLNIREEGRFTSFLRLTRNDIDLPQGKFVTNLASARATYNFSPLMNASALVQYNDRTRRWSTNLRFTWLRTGRGALRRVQRHRKLQRPRPAQSGVHHQVLTPGGSASVGFRL
jgi:hypothetical protein